MTKFRWGLIGGGEGSQIGPAHRLGALADGLFEFSAAALDHRPDVGRSYAKTLGVSENRAYGDWNEMLTSEAKREDRIDLVTVATPNSTHFEITKAFLEAGFHVLCEKPLAATAEDAQEMVDACQRAGVCFMDNTMMMHHDRLGAMEKVLKNVELFGSVKHVVSCFTIPFGNDEEWKQNS